MAEPKETQNAKNAAGEPIDKKGNRIIDLSKTNKYFVTDKHPFAKELGGVGKPVNVSAHTHGPAQLKKGWLSTEPIKAAVKA